MPPTARRRVAPPPLRPGDAVGLIAPSSDSAARHPRRFARAVAALRALGYEVRVGAHATGSTGAASGPSEGGGGTGPPGNRAVSGGIAERVEDIHALATDDSVRAVMTIIGGNHASQLLEHLDYDLIARHPKIYVGYSDATALLTAIWVRTGLGVVMGPQLLPQFGEPGGPLADTVRWWQQVLGEGRPAGEIAPSAQWTDEYLLWDVHDDRLRTLAANPGPYAVCDGRASGPLYAANIQTLLRLAGTPWWPDLRGCVVMLESTVPVPLGLLDAALTQLRHIGVFDQAAAVGFGRFGSETPHDRTAALARLLDRTLRGFDGPVVGGLDIGHTDPMCCVPYGVHATLTVGGRIRLEYQEPAVGPAEP